MPPSTRACTIGCLVLSCRSVAASMRSTTWRFSSSLVGTASPRKRPEPSRYETRGPSMKISSTSRRASRSVRGPRSVIERSTRSARSDGSASGQVLAEHGRSLVLVDGGADLASYRVEVDLGPQATTVDPDVHLASDGVVRVDGHRDRRRRRVCGAGAIAPATRRARGVERTAARSVCRPTPPARRRGRADTTPIDVGVIVRVDLGPDLLLPEAARAAPGSRRGAAAWIPHDRRRRPSTRARAPPRPGSRASTPTTTSATPVDARAPSASVPPDPTTTNA